MYVVMICCLKLRSTPSKLTDFRGYTRHRRQDEKMRIDLHLHSTFSDGLLSPEELVACARERELAAISLADHDTTDGTARFITAARAAGIKAISCIELSASFATGSLHLLGYGLDASAQCLQESLRWVRDRRNERNVAILERLPDCGIEISRDELLAAAGEGVPGRPHIADVLVEKGYVKDRRRAFARYLARGRPAYVPRRHLSARQALRVIADAGGIAVLAHPVSLCISGRKLHNLLVELKEDGLAGVEVYHPRQSVRFRTRLWKIAEETGLFVTGGSDFHGGLMQAACLGRAGNGIVPAELLEQLQHALDRRSSVSRQQNSAFG